MKFPAIIVFAIIALASCQPPTDSLPEEDIAAIQSLIADFDQAALASDWDAFIGMFTEDGILMQPNDAVIPIGDFRAWITPMGYSALEHEIEFVDIEGCGDLAYARGRYSERFTVTGVDEPIEDEGKILAILRRQTDGSWLFSVWSSSSDLPVMDG